MAESTGYSPPKRIRELVTRLLGHYEPLKIGTPKTKNAHVVTDAIRLGKRWGAWIRRERDRLEEMCVGRPARERWYAVIRFTIKKDKYVSDYAVLICTVDRPLPKPEMTERQLGRWLDKQESEFATCEGTGKVGER